MQKAQVLNNDSDSSVTEVLTHYCIVRTDLPLGVVCAQLVHAAGESSPGKLASGTYAVVLGIPTAEKLLALEKKLIEENISHLAIREPDTPYCGEIMAIGILPMSREPLRKILGKLPLLRKLTGAKNE